MSASRSARPSATTPVAVIGVIGHHVLNDSGRLTAGIDEALDRIESHFRGPLVVMASLAEGADRLVVRRALKRLRVSTFVAPLPFVRQEFEHDFRAPGSLEEFRSLIARAQYVLQLPPPHGTPRALAYALAGRFILERAHVLLAVWDGTPSRGEDPTGDVITIARRIDMKIAWVHARDGTNAEAPAPTGCAPGTVTFEGL